MTSPSRPTVAFHEPVEARLRPHVVTEFAAAGLDCVFLAADVPASAETPCAHEVVAAVVGPPVPVTADLRTAYPAVRVVVTPSVGTDHIDVPALLRLGIRVLHLTDYCTQEVADHTLALILASLRRLSDGDRAVRSGRWVVSSTPRPVAGTTLGLVGFGRIARAVAHRALALGMRVVAFDPAQEDDVFAREAVGRASTLGDLLATSEVVSLHLPLTDRTHHLIDAAALAAMPPGSMLINVSRGGLVDERALAAALADGQLSCAGVDTFETEPPSAESELLACRNAVLTPHIAWLSDESPRRAVMQSVALAIDALATTDHAPMP